MIRQLLALAAACLLGAATPASAALLNLSGTMTGQQITIVCAVGDGACLTAKGSITATQDFGKDFLQTLFLPTLQQGDNSFSFGSPTGIGVFSGVINNNNGVLTGRNLDYSFYDIGMPSGIVGSRTIFASARTFSVSAVAPVPEPATWAMMLLGFLGLGTAMRRTQRPALAIA